MNKWLIKSTTRTVSHLVFSLLEASGLRSEHVWFSKYREHNSPPVWPILANHDNLKLTLEDDNIVIHDHTTWIPPDPENWNIVYTVRQDKAAQTLSSLFAEKLDEYVAEGVGVLTYSDKQISPFHLDTKQVVKSHWERIHYENNMKNLLDSYTWKSFNLMYFEDLIKTTPEVVSHLLQIDYDKDKCKWNEQKNPRKAQDIILNYNELYNVLSEITRNH